MVLTTLVVTAMSVMATVVLIVGVPPVRPRAAATPVVVTPGPSCSSVAWTAQLGGRLYGVVNTNVVMPDQS